MMQQQKQTIQWYTMCKRVLVIFLMVFIVLIYFLQDSLQSIMKNPKFNWLPKPPIFKVKENTTISNNKSYICDKTTHVNQTLSTNFNLSFHRAAVLHSYCSIVPTPRKNWTRSVRYSESDIDFVIFTGAIFYHSRATAVRDTWLSRVSNFHFLSTTPYPPLPITVVTGAGEDYLSNMKKIFYGLQIIYKEQQEKPFTQRQKWFYIAGCDTYVNVEHILKRLDPFDHNQPMLIGGHMLYHETCKDVTTKRHPRITFPSGGGGIFFSSKLLEIMQPHLSNYVEKVWPRDSPASDVALTCLAQKLGVKVTDVPGFWIFPPLITLRRKERGRAHLHSDPEPNTFHYIDPAEMYVLDEFYIHQYVDRLINDANWSELSTFIRRFIVSHYQILLIKGKECTSPSTKL